MNRNTYTIPGKRILLRNLMLLSLLLTVMILFSQVARADSNMRAARIKNVSGTAKIKKAGGEKAYPALEGMGLVQGDSIITGSSGQVILEMDGDKEVRIGSNTQMILSELVKSASAMGSKTSLGLLSGKVLITINKKLSQDSKFEIKTPTAIMGVRGTAFYVGFYDGQTVVDVVDGTVNAENTQNGSTVDIPQNSSAVINKTGEQPAPIVLHRVELQDLDLFMLQGIKNNNRASEELKKQLDEVIQQKQQELQNNPPPADDQTGENTAPVILYTDKAVEDEIALQKALEEKAAAEKKAAEEKAAAEKAAAEKAAAEKAAADKAAADKAAADQAAAAAAAAQAAAQEAARQAALRAAQAAAEAAALAAQNNQSADVTQIDNSDDYTGNLTLNVGSGTYGPNSANRRNIAGNVTVNSADGDIVLRNLNISGTLTINCDSDGDGVGSVTLHKITASSVIVQSVGSSGVQLEGMCTISSFVDNDASTIISGDGTSDITNVSICNSAPALNNGVIELARMNISCLNISSTADAIVKVGQGITLSTATIASTTGAAVTLDLNGHSLTNVSIGSGTHTLIKNGNITGAVALSNSADSLTFEDICFQAAVTNQSDGTVFNNCTFMSDFTADENATLTHVEWMNSAPANIEIADCKELKITDQISLGGSDQVILLGGGTLKAATDVWDTTTSILAPNQSTSDYRLHVDAGVTINYLKIYANMEINDNASLNDDILENNVHVVHGTPTFTDCRYLGEASTVQICSNTYFRCVEWNAQTSIVVASGIQLSLSGNINNGSMITGDGTAVAQFNQVMQYANAVKPYDAFPIYNDSILQTSIQDLNLAVTITRDSNSIPLTGELIFNRMAINTCTSDLSRWVFADSDGTPVSVMDNGNLVPGATLMPSINGDNSILAFTIRSSVPEGNYKIVFSGESTHMAFPTANPGAALSGIITNGIRLIPAP